MPTVMAMYLVVTQLLISDLSAQTQAADRPNIIVFFSDDHGWADLGCQDIEDDIRTPHIDALAAAGVRMTDGYVTAPQCVPSRAGLLTVRAQNRFGLESNGQPLEGFNAQQTIAERLQAAGYATGMAGKWHLGAAPEIPSHGFDSVFNKNSNRPGWSNFGISGRPQTPGPDPQPGYHIDLCSRAACGFIKRNLNKPFFFYCAYRAPHVPLDAPRVYLNRFPGPMPERRRQALAMISAMDDGVGQVVKTLSAHGLEEKTLLFYIGDNGAPLKIHKLDAPGGGPGWDGSHNLPMNGEKGMLTEGGIRVPFVASWKGTIPPGQTYIHSVTSLDVAATAASIAQLDVPEDQLDGVNLVPYLTGEIDGPPHETLFWRWIAQSAARSGQWKYLRGGQREYLFDLEADPSETQNLIADEPTIAARLRSQLENWAEDLEPPGLATNEMSSTWETYFDHYLDGKRAELPTRQRQPASKNLPAGWVVRSGQADLTDGGLQVTSEKDAKGAFLAISRIKLPSSFRVITKQRSGSRRPVRIAWRDENQKDFQPGDIASPSDPVDASGQASVDVQADAGVIHLRLLLPPQGTAIERVTIQDGQGKTINEWTFVD